MPSIQKQRTQPERPSFDKLPDCAYVRLAQLIPGILPVGRTALYEMIKQQRFPAPEKLGYKTSVWNVGQLRAWMRNPAGWRPDEAAFANEAKGDLA